MPEGDSASVTATNAQCVHLKISGLARQRLSRPVKAIGQVLQAGQAISRRSADAIARTSISDAASFIETGGHVEGSNRLNVMCWHRLS